MDKIIISPILSDFSCTTISISMSGEDYILNIGENSYHLDMNDFYSILLGELPLPGRCGVYINLIIEDFPIVFNDDFSQSNKPDFNLRTVLKECDGLDVVDCDIILSCGYSGYKFDLSKLKIFPHHYRRFRVYPFYENSLHKIEGVIERKRKHESDYFVVTSNYRFNHPYNFMKVIRKLFDVIEEPYVKEE